MMKNWKEKDRILVLKIQKFCEEYEKKYGEEFKKNRYLAHQKMCSASGRKFKVEIENQVTNLLEFRNNRITLNPRPHRHKALEYYGGKSCGEISQDKDWYPYSP